MIYLKSGNVPLNLAYEDAITQEANSTYQLSFRYPYSDNLWQELTRETFLLADDLHGEQEFIIIETTKEQGYIQVYANQVATLLNYYSIDVISVDRQTGQTVMSDLAGSIKRKNPFSFFSDITTPHTLNVSDISAMDALAGKDHSIIGEWGGDLVRDKYQVKLLKNGGSENESLFMYKKNLGNYKESGNIKNLRTRIHFKKIIQGKREGEEDTVLTATIDSPLIGKYSQIYEANLEVNDQDVKDQATLEEYGRNYYKTTLCDVVEDTIEIDVKGKSDVPIKMFDTVSVFHERFGVDMRLKISKYTFTPMAKRLKTIGFGSVQRSLGASISSQVSSAVEKATAKTVSDFEARLERKLENADKNFDRDFETQKTEILDSVEQAKAEAEVKIAEAKQTLGDKIAEMEETLANSKVDEAQIQAILDRSTAGMSEKLQEDARKLIEQAKLETDGKMNQAKLDMTDQIKSEVTKVEGKIPVSIGFRNLIIGTNDMSSFFSNGNIRAANQVFYDSNEDAINIKVSGVTDNLWAGFWFHLALDQMKSGEKYAIRVPVYVDPSIPMDKNLVFNAKIHETNTDNNMRWYTPSELKKGEWQNIEFVFENTVERVSTADRRLTFFVYLEKNGWVKVKKPIMVRGDVIPTDWSPAPEDFDSDLTVLKSSVTQNSDQITQLLTKTSLNGDAITSAQNLIKSTADSFNRTLTQAQSDLGKKISQVAQTADGIVSTVSSMRIGARNYILNSNFQSPNAGSSQGWGKKTSGFNIEWDEGLSAYHLYNTDTETAKNVRWQGLTQMLKMSFSAGDKVTLSMLLARENNVTSGGANVGIHMRKNGQIVSQIWKVFKQSEMTNRDFARYSVTFTLDKSTDEIILMIYGADNQYSNYFIREIKLEKGSIATDWTPAPEDTQTAVNAVSTQVSQLAGSWAVRNLTSAGTVLNQLNLNKDGTVKIDGKLVHISGETLIDNAVIKSAMVDKLKTANFEAGSVTSTVIAANAVTADKMVVDQAFFNKLMANQAYLRQLFAKEAFINQVQSVRISADQISGGQIVSQNGATDINLNDGTIEFRTSDVALFRKKNTHTAFVHFNDVAAESDGGVGSLYAAIGVTSGGHGINSQSSGKFAGLRAFRASSGTTGLATADQLELYGDDILFRESFDTKYKVVFDISNLDKDYKFTDLVGVVKFLARVYVHLSNVGGDWHNKDFNNAFLNEYNKYNVKGILNMPEPRGGFGFY